MHTQCEQCMELCVDDVHLQTIIKIRYIMHACCVAKMVYTCMLCQDAAVSQVSVFFSPVRACVAHAFAWHLLLWVRDSDAEEGA